MAKGKEIHFGQLAIVLGFVSPASVAECLKLQKMALQKGEKKQLGKILVEQGALSEEQFKTILEKQGVSHFSCSECDVEYTIEELSGNDLFECSKCSGPLTAVSIKQKTESKPHEKDTLLDKVIGGTRIASRLKDGNFTKVYKGIQVEKQREVLVRVLKKDFSTNPVKAKRFMERAARLAKISHASIANTYDVREENGIFFTIEEMVDGTTLETLLDQQTKLPPMQAVRIALQIAQGLKVVHSKKLVHGILSASTIMINRKGRAVLIDIANSPVILTSEDVFNRTDLVSPEYAASETIKDATRATIRSDLFSLGALLYRIISGKGPFTGESPFETLLNNLQGKTLKLEQVVKDLPGDLSGIIDKLLKRNPMMRYENAGQVVAAFESLDVSAIPQSVLQEAKEAAPVKKKPSKKSAKTPELELPDDVDEMPKLKLEPEDDSEISLSDENAVSSDLMADAMLQTPTNLAELEEELGDSFTPEEPPEIQVKAAKASHDLDEVSAFLEDEEEPAELTAAEKEQILEEGLREESREIMPSPELIEAMAQAGKKKKSLLPVVIAFAAVAVLVVIFILVSGFGGDNGKQEESVGQDLYEEAIEYAKQHPDSPDDQMNMFREVMQKYPSTRWANKARVKIAEIEGGIEDAKEEEKWKEVLVQIGESPGSALKQIEILRTYIRENPSTKHMDEAKAKISAIQSENTRDEATAYVMETRTKTSRMCEEENYRDALDLLEKGMPAGMPTDPFEKQLHEIRNTVYEKARDSFNKASAKARSFAREGKLAEAISLLESIISNFGIEEYAAKARKTRAELLNEKFERDDLTEAAYFGAVQAAAGLAANGRFETAKAVLDAFESEYSPGARYGDKISHIKEWIDAAAKFLGYADEHFTKNIGKFISFRSSSGISYQGTLKKFENKMITVGELPPLSITEIPRSELVRLAREGAAADGGRSKFIEAAYHYISGDIETAGSLVSRTDTGAARALAYEILRITKARSVVRNARLFNGVDLEGWNGDSKKWSVKDGLLAGEKGSIELKTPPTGNYILTFRVRQTSGAKGLDIVFPAGAGNITWHIGSEKESFSQVKDVSSTRNDFKAVESVWLRIAVIVTGGVAEGLVGNETAWKLDSLEDVPPGEAKLAFMVNDGIFEFGRIFLKQYR